MVLDDLVAGAEAWLTIVDLGGPPSSHGSNATRCRAVCLGGRSGPEAPAVEAKTPAVTAAATIAVPTARSMPADRMLDRSRAFV